MAALFVVSSVGMLLGAGSARPPTLTSTPPSTHAPTVNEQHTGQHHNQTTVALRRNDSEWSLGLSRSDSVAQTLNELGQPCFYGLPATVQQLVWENAAFVGAGVAILAVAMYTELLGGGLDNSGRSTGAK